MSKKTYKAIFVITKSIYKYQNKMLRFFEAKAKAQFSNETTETLDSKIDKYQRICTDLALVKSALKTTKEDNLIKVEVLGVKEDKSLIYKEVFMSLEKAGLYIDADADVDNELILTWK